MASGAQPRLADRVRRGVEDVSWRTRAVMDRIALRWRLPPPVANGRVRTSQYVAVRDGTKLAADLYRPTNRGALLDGPLPVVWTFERYHRARMEGGRLRTRLDSEYWLEALIRHGYVVCVADVRGSGASFGSRRGLVIEEDRWDAHDMTEWLAAQPWSNGRVGMFGKSFMGLTQFLAASTAPPHLRAIFPEKTMFDLYAFAYSGGVYRHDYARDWGANTTALDQVTLAAPVDDDPHGVERDRAVAEHQGNRDVDQLFASLPFRDSVGDRADERPYVEQSPSRHCDDVANSGVPVFQLAGWHDMWPRDALLWHRNLPNPRKLLIGPWGHTQDSAWQLFPDRLRWFDHWLKGIDNGVMDEPPVRYFTAGARGGSSWRSANQWPLPTELPTPFYFAATETSGQGNAHGLVERAPDSRSDGSAVDSYTIDYSTTSGAGTRWKNGYGLELRYPDMSRNDGKALTYTTDVLQHDVELTGQPIVCLWVSSAAIDVDLFAYLEDVRPSGYSEYVTEGVLRASHRLEHSASFDHLGMPFHRSFIEDSVALASSEATLLRFDLHPLSRVFRRGHRIRVAITGADADNALTPVVDPAPVISVHRSTMHASHIILPVIRAES